MSSTRAILVVLFITLNGCSSNAGYAAQKPNVLFIAIDDLRPELGCYGCKEVLSPHIDSVAAQGIAFHRAYCQVVVCGPSRASMLTSLRPTDDRFQHWNCKVDVDALGVPTMPETFRRAGYVTISNGKIFHHQDDTAERSWSEEPFTLVPDHLEYFATESSKFINPNSKRGPFYEAPDVPDNTYIDGRTCEKTIDDLQRLAKQDRPFFLACGFVRPHLPFYAPKKYWGKYENPLTLAQNRYRPKNAPRFLIAPREFQSYHDRDIAFNSDVFHRTAKHGYYACISYVDALVGKILAALKELNLRDNTIIVIWGDHGWNLGEHNFWSKHTLLHNSTNAPLIISAPSLEPTVATDGIVEFVDILPTLGELCQIDVPSAIEGTSMVPLMEDPSRAWKKAAFTQYSNGSTVTTRDFTYTLYSSGSGRARMLFDRRTDPLENVNVADNIEYRGTIEQLDQILAQGWRSALPSQ